MEEEADDGRIHCECCDVLVDHIILTDLRAGKIWGLCKNCSGFSTQRLTEQLAFTHGALLNQTHQLVAQKAQLDAFMAVIERFALKNEAAAAVKATTKPQPRRKK